jgi:hypothetical protein
MSEKNIQLIISFGEKLKIPWLYVPISQIHITEHIKILTYSIKEAPLTFVSAKFLYVWHGFSPLKGGEEEFS